MQPQPEENTAFLAGTHLRRASLERFALKCWRRKNESAPRRDFQSLGPQPLWRSEQCSGTAQNNYAFDKAFVLTRSVSAGIFPSESKPVKAKLMAGENAKCSCGGCPVTESRGLHPPFERTVTRRSVSENKFRHGAASRGDAFIENKGTSWVRSAKNSAAGLRARAQECIAIRNRR